MCACSYILHRVLTRVTIEQPDSAQAQKTTAARYVHTYVVENEHYSTLSGLIRLNALLESLQIFCVPL